jgi:DNA-binding response OmpR family regulator
MRIAIIDRDPAFERDVLRAARQTGVAAVRLGQGDASVSLLKSQRVDAVIFDPGAEPIWDWLAETCSALPDLSVLVCTARSEVSTRVRALRLGAEDWITKPVSMVELMTRAEVARRGHRASVRPLAGVLVSGELELHPADLDARAGGGRIDLSRREFELLHFLVAEQGRVLEREEIYRRVWGYSMVPGDRSVDTYIRKLRIKLGTVSPGWAYIHTHFGIGYRLEARPTGDAGGHAWDHGRQALGAV